MLIWLALLLPPVLALADLAIGYALAAPSCETQSAAWLHLLPLTLLAVMLWLAAEAARESRRLDAKEASAASEATTFRRRMMARAAVRSALLSALVLVALWIPQWLLPPCVA